MAQDNHPRRVSLVFPIILITVGALFLLHSWRPVFDPVPILWRYWPRILIFIGAGKIWDNLQRSRTPNAPQRVSIGASIGALAFVIVLAALLWHGRSFSRGHSFYSGTRHSTKIVEPQRAKSARARLEMGAGQLTINSGTSDLLDADFTYSGSYEEPRVDYSVADGVGQLNISQDSQSLHFGRSQNDWILHFSKDIPLDLRVEMGAGQGNLHLREVPLTRLDLHMGASRHPPSEKRWRHCSCFRWHRLHRRPRPEARRGLLHQRCLWKIPRHDSPESARRNRPDHPHPGTVNLPATTSRFAPL